MAGIEPTSLPNYIWKRNTSLPHWLSSGKLSFPYINHEKDSIYIERDLLPFGLTSPFSIYLKEGGPYRYLNPSPFQFSNSQSLLGV